MIPIAQKTPVIASNVSTVKESAMSNLDATENSCRVETVARTCLSGEADT